MPVRKIVRCTLRRSGIELLLLLSAALMVHAGPLSITNGGAVFSSNGSFTGGSAQFSVSSPIANISGDGSYRPSVGFCEDPSALCAPGTTHTAFGAAISAAFPASQGMSLSGCLLGVCGGGLGFDASDISGGFSFQTTFTVPNVGPILPDTLTFTAPFTGDAGLSFPIFGSNPPDSVTIDMAGQGVATITLARYAGNPGLYQLQTAEFTFSPVPEPASILLCAAGWIVLRFKRRAR